MQTMNDTQFAALLDELAAALGLSPELAAAAKRCALEELDTARCERARAERGPAPVRLSPRQFRVTLQAIDAALAA